MCLVANAQNRKIETDTLKARKALKIQNGTAFKNVTSFLTALNNSNRILTSAIEDSQVTRAKLSATVNILLGGSGNGSGYPPDDVTLEFKIAASDTSLRITHLYLVDSVGQSIKDSINNIVIDSNSVVNGDLSVDDIYSGSTTNTVFRHTPAGNSFGRIDSTYIVDGSIDQNDLWSSGFNLDGTGLTSVNDLTFGQSATGLNVNVDGSTIVITDDTLSLWSSDMNLGGSGLTDITDVTFGQSHTGLNVNVDNESIEISTDTLQVNAVAGFMFVDDDTQAVAIVSAGTYYDIDEYTQAETDLHLSCDNGAGTITIDYDGIYNINGNFSWYSNTDTTIHVVLYKNSVKQESIGFKSESIASGNMQSTSAQGVLSLSAGDELIWKVTSNAAASVTFYYTYSQFSVFMIGK
jgi:hypothetical protein